MLGSEFARIKTFAPANVKDADSTSRLTLRLRRVFNFCRQVVSVVSLMKFFLWIDGKQDGPFEPEQIRAMLGEGSIAAATLGCPEDGTGEWKPISNYDEIVEPPQPVEPTPAAPPVPASAPPEQNSKFPWKPITISSVVLVLLVSVIAGFVHRQNRKFWLDFHPTMAMLRAEGTNEIREDISNSVVGITRIVEIRVTLANSPWRGMATYEFVNKVGGVERGRKVYVFDTILTNSDGGIMDISARESPAQVKLEQMAAEGNQDAIDALKKFGISSP